MENDNDTSKTATRGPLAVAGRAYLSAVLVIAALGSAVYVKALGAPFHFDDYRYILFNENLRSFSNFWPPLSTRYVGYFTFALNYAVSADKAWPYHLVNILIHLSNAVLVFSLLLLTVRTPRVLPAVRSRGGLRGSPAVHLAFVAALVFVLHPVETQAVTYVTQRFASLATFFYLLSLTLYVLYRLTSGRGRAPVYYSAALVSCLAAQLTKEISFTLPAVMVLYEYTFFATDQGRGTGRRLVRLAPFLVQMLVIPLLVAGPGMGLFEAASGPGVNLRAFQMKDLLTLSRHDYLVTQFRVIVTYIRLLLLPVAQNVDYDYRVFGSVLVPEVFASLAFLVSLLAANAWLYVRSIRRGDGYALMASFWVFWFFMTLSVESSVIPIKDVIFEHRLYLPSIGFFAAASTFLFRAVERASRPWKATLAVFVLAALPLGAAAYARNSLWSDKIALYEQVVRRSPAKRRPHFTLGRAYTQAGRYEEAVGELKAAIALDPGFARSYSFLGRSYYMLGRNYEAMEAYGKALAMRPYVAEDHMGLGAAYHRAGLLDKAVEQYKLALRLDPELVRVRFSLGSAYLDSGRIPDAIWELEMFIALAPPAMAEQKARAVVLLRRIRGSSSAR